MINCNNGFCKKINYKGNDVKYLKLNDTMVWVKPFTLTFSRGGGVDYLIVKRVSTIEPSASTGYLNTGNRIFYGDVLEVAASAQSQFELNPYTTRYEVKNDIAIQVTAKQVLFNVEIRAMYNGTILASTIKYNVPLGTTVYSSEYYGATFNQNDYVYSNPRTTSQKISTAGVVLTTTYSSRSNPKTTAPRLSYQYLDEDVSQETYYFELYIYDLGNLGGRVYAYVSDSPTCDDYTMQYLQKYIGVLGSDFSLTHSITTTYDKPDIYVHIRINRGNEYTEISSIRISA